jgi:hypothetical protein
MGRVRAIVAALGVAALFLLASGLSSATTCIDLPPLKPVHRICGVVFFSNSDRIAKAKVTVLQATKEIATEETDNDGKFSFDRLEAGKYEIRVHVEPLRVATTQVVLVHPKDKTSQEIAVNISLVGCHAFSLVNSKKFEARLNPPA